MGPGSQLTTDERQRALVAHAKVMKDKLWVTSAFELQNICAEIALQPSIEEIDAALLANGGRVDFAGLLSFVRDMKAGFYTPEPRDADTVRAFMAVGGAHDKTGSVDADVLRQACRRFSLNVDVDGMFETEEPQQDVAASLQFVEFQNLLSPESGEQPASDDGVNLQSSGLKLGIDYKGLVEREASDAAQAAPRRRSNKAAPRRSFFVKPASTQDLPPINPRQPPQEMDATARLRAKGIAPALYGGPTLAEIRDKPLSDSDPAQPRRRRKRRARQAKSSPATILGEGTHVVGRRGLLVDDPPRLPRHYPQQHVAQGAEGSLSLSQAAGVRLPPIHQKAMMSPRGSPDPAVDERLSSIQRRMGELSRRKLRGAARYKDVQSRVNVSGSPRFMPVSTTVSAGSQPA